ncbi:hypothetical protein D3C71_809300 [compost metagenome]
MKTLGKITLVLSLAFVSLASCGAQIKNEKTQTLKVYGNCGMCKTNIETAGNKNKTAQVEWDQTTKMAVIKYDSVKTSSEEILKRIALAGYDSEKFFAPTDAYNKLAECCQYKRAKTETAKVESTEHSEETKISEQKTDQLKAVFNTYFAIKDALVKTDGNSASAQAKNLLTAINTVKMDQLSSEEHVVWMKVLKDLTADAEHILGTKDASHQRDHFASLSKNMYELIKVSKPETPVYFQHCPMYNDGKGADWLSKENAIKNPYYGSQMMTCGKTVETIK